MFSDERIIKDFLYNNNRYFSGLVSEKINRVKIDKLHMRHWTFKLAYPESDIIWEDLCKDSIISTFKSFVLLILLFILSVVLLTPLLLINISS